MKGIERSAEQTPEQQARIFVGGRGIPGDSFNAVAAIKLMIDEPELFSQITPVHTYEEYMRLDKFDHKPVIAEAVIAATNPELIARFNNVVQRINQRIGNGVTTQEQANAVGALADELRTVIYG